MTPTKRGVQTYIDLVIFFASKTFAPSPGPWLALPSGACGATAAWEELCTSSLVAATDEIFDAIDIIIDDNLSRKAMCGGLNVISERFNIAK